MPNLVRCETEQQITPTTMDWFHLLRLALQFGWQPQGTVPSQITAEFYVPKDSQWIADYWSPCFQVVTAEDAKALAEALKRALPSLPDEWKLEWVAEKTREKDNFKLTAELCHCAPHTEWFSGSGGQEKIRLAIEFFEEGQFAIH